MKKFALLSLMLLSATGTAPAKAQSIESSWFEIELLAFSRDELQALLEKFPPQVTPINVAGAVDLLSPLYQPDLTALATALPGCQTNTAGLETEPTLQLDIQTATTPLFIVDEASLADFSFRQNQSSLNLTATFELPQLCPLTSTTGADKEPDYQLMQPPLLAAPQAAPLTPAGSDTHQNSIYLAPETALALNDLAYQLKHRAGHQLLLHTVWRQQLGTKRQSVPSRWFGGRNFAQSFDYFGRAKASQPDLTHSQEQRLTSQIQLLEQQLQRQPKQPLQSDPLLQHQAVAAGAVWQLDGLIRLYSERMLFAETEFNLRKLSADGSQLQSFHSKEQTRLLIGNLHYLDHPHLGLILQIRRFTPPMATPDLTPDITPDIAPVTTP
ncbi:CsiV family protein [Rheinheimera sp.]|uniref:CsiV family protein n=1 Tax=Rheinheimera sp. TaxID=1869214 RepID=UPI0027B94196|nr:CsiV family protein [Rheinheimera sp.]